MRSSLLSRRNIYKSLQRSSSATTLTWLLVSILFMATSKHQKIPSCWGATSKSFWPLDQSDGNRRCRAQQCPWTYFRSHEWWFDRIRVPGRTHAWLVKCWKGVLRRLHRLSYHKRPYESPRPPGTLVDMNWELYTFLPRPNIFDNTDRRSNILANCQKNSNQAFWRTYPFITRKFLKVMYNSLPLLRKINIFQKTWLHQARTMYEILFSFERGGLMIELFFKKKYSPFSKNYLLGCDKGTVIMPDHLQHVESTS